MVVSLSSPYIALHNLEASVEIAELSLPNNCANVVGIFQ